MLFSKRFGHAVQQMVRSCVGHVVQQMFRRVAQQMFVWLFRVSNSGTSWMPVYELIFADIFQQGDTFPANSCYFNRDRVVQLCPPARPYIKKSFDGILMYELVEDYVNKYCNYVDPNFNRVDERCLTKWIHMYYRYSQCFACLFDNRFVWLLDNWLVWLLYNWLIWLLSVDVLHVFTMFRAAVHQMFRRIDLN